MKNEQPLKQLKRRMLGSIFLWMALCIVMAGVVYYVVYQYYFAHTWFGYESFYILVQKAQESVHVWLPAYLIVCLAVIWHHYWKKTFSYLQEVVSATEQFYGENTSLIALSPRLHEVESRMNQTKLNIVNNERIAKEAEQRKNDLVTYLAHDLKTPITSVIGYLTLLRDEPQISPELRAKYTGIALDKSERLEELINEFFDITRFNLSEITLEPERVNLSRMLEQVVSEFEPVLLEKQLSWHVKIMPEVEVLCDPDKLARVFDNLVRNAVSYSYRGTEIFLSMVKNEKDIEICVRNHGKTIPEEKLARIFEQFFRLDSARGTATGGSGLGLAIAKEIIELHGGTIRAESKQEMIEFYVYLPAGGRE